MLYLISLASKNDWLQNDNNSHYDWPSFDSRAHYLPKYEQSSLTYDSNAAVQVKGRTCSEQSESTAVGAATPRCCLLSGAIQRNTFPIFLQWSWFPFPALKGSWEQGRRRSMTSIEVLGMLAYPAHIWTANGGRRHQSNGTTQHPFPYLNKLLS